MGTDPNEYKIVLLINKKYKDFTILLPVGLFTIVTGGRLSFLTQLLCHFYIGCKIFRN